ncbi:MAG TPA: efflux RND transporter periplasmic adaptor subunit [Patescibacteria group bacterium]|nr:efflux RND transporter periplasmic adaptor subunit [Patescibacteria group bacterium]
MVRDELVDYARRKNVTGKLLVTFIIMMVLLTFFSNTINNFTLTRVTLESSTRGALVKEISGEGRIEATTVFEQYIDTNLKVLDVYVQAGDTVKQGQAILDLDIDGLKSSLQDENARYRQQQITLDKLRDSSSLLNYDSNIERALENMEKQTKNYQDIKTLFDSGYELESNVRNAEIAMNDAKRTYNKAVQDKDEFLRNNQRDIENAQLNLEIAARRIDTLNKQVANNGTYVATADGIITELNFIKGTMANSSKPLFKLAEASGGFQFTVSVHRDLAAHIKAGDEVDVYITSLGDKGIKGQLAQIKEDLQNGDNKELLIDVKDEELQGGENAQIMISKRTKQYSALVPNSAVYSDSDGYYVFVVKKKDSPLGTESYVQRVDVTVEDSDSTMTAVGNGIMSMDKVVTESTRSLADGDRVVVEQ